MKKSEECITKGNVENELKKSEECITKGNVEKELKKSEECIMKGNVEEESKKSFSENVFDVVVNEKKQSFCRRLMMIMTINQGLVKISTLKNDLHSSFTEKEIDTFIKQLFDEEKIFIDKEYIYEI